MRHHSILFVLLCLISVSGLAATRVSVTSGDWSNASSWSPAGIPGCGDSIVIDQTHTISISSQQDYVPCLQALKIAVYGTLKFLGGSKLKLPCGSYVIVYSGASVLPDQGFANSNFIQICGQQEWSSTPLYGPACLPHTHPYCSAFLPVEWGFFDAVGCAAKRVCLTWETMSEQNCDYFEVERSFDGAHFEALGRLGSKALQGNSTHTLRYQFDDLTADDGLLFYRLRKVDRDQTFSYSTVTYARAFSHDKDQRVSLQAYPNSNFGEFTLRIAGVEGRQAAELSLCDISGSVVYHSLEMLEPGESRLLVRPGALSGGLYFCRVQSASLDETIKLVIRH